MEVISLSLTDLILIMIFLPVFLLEGGKSPPLPHNLAIFRFGGNSGFLGGNSAFIPPPAKYFCYYDSWLNGK
jgi:hypothetical protein